MFDLHTHSTASDGDASPADVARAAAQVGLSGLSLTDHNGLWGIDEARAAAEKLGLTFIEGIEVTARDREVDVHILGYSSAFDRVRLEEGLASTRAGYETRVREMVERCQAAGYPKVTWEGVAARRKNFANPCYVSFDVAREISTQYGLALEAARKLTVGGGACHVPYGDWALSPQAAVTLIHEAGGIASLAHPGTIERESRREVLLQLLGELKAAALDGLEIAHPFHAAAYQDFLKTLAGQIGLIETGGSDWHGAEHLPANDAAFGNVGVSALPAL